MNITTVHCDGSFNRHTGRGGYGAVIHHKGKVFEQSEAYESIRSSARAEMIGMIRSIEVYGPKATRIQIYSDAKYIIDGINIHLDKWIKTGMINKLVNKDLWLQIKALMNRYTIEWFWVKGHSDDVHNNRADYLAREAVEDITW
jgi:ribonuclease HI